MRPDEDIHTLVERMLYEEVGDVAGKLHTGRSRNDQVATDARLWTLRACARIERELRAAQQALCSSRRKNTIDVLMPAYTHLRRAQPVRAAHWLLAHFWALQRDRERLRGAVERVAVLPLGSGAIAAPASPSTARSSRSCSGSAPSRRTPSTPSATATGSARCSSSRP
jgi:argininosuccinate lyase